jgi:hypothetical protein
MLQDPENDASYFQYNFPGISIIYKAHAFIKTDMMEHLSDYDGPSERYGSDTSEEFEDFDEVENLLKEGRCFARQKRVLYIK